MLFFSGTRSRDSFNPDRDVPDLSGKVILITGGTTGLGESSLHQLARHKPGAIYFTGRNTKSANEIIEKAKHAFPGTAVAFLECDFTDLQTVKAAAERFLSLSNRLDILMCNAGIMAVPAARTKDGYEVQFGTNHLAHALLIRRLLPRLQATASQNGGDARIIINSSLGYTLVTDKNGIAFDKLRGDGSDMGLGAPWLCYAQSKLANILYTMQLAKRYPDVKTVVIHPGVVETKLVSDLGFWNRMLVRVTNPRGLMTPEEGAHTQVWAATMPNVETGTYYEPVGKVGDRTEISRDEKLAERLWNWTEEELRPFMV